MKICIRYLNSTSENLKSSWICIFKNLKQAKRKNWKEQFRPFSFILVGLQTIEEDGKLVKSIASFTKNYQKIVYEPFIDYETGEIKEGSQYSKR